MVSNKLHVTLGLLIWGFVTLLFKTTQKFSIVSFFVAVVGASLPDVDLFLRAWMNHRGITHTIRFGLVYSCGVVILSSCIFSIYETTSLSLLAFLSFTSHLILDQHIRF